MGVFKKAKWDVLNAVIVGLILFGTISVSGDEVDTIIGIDPSSQNVSAEDTFDVNVSCIPSQAVKAFEFKLSFNPSLLQANSVTEGDIFDGYTTFFNPGTIDNSAGTIVDVYSLIIGPGNVSNVGTFVTISFTAKTTSGTSSLDIYDVGVTDETRYISINVSDGGVTVQGTGGGSPPGGGGYMPPAGEDNDGNNAPETPMAPFGPAFVEMGVEYMYMSSTVDVDGDQIRFRFDWGDGNYSDWSEYVASNISLSMSHYWASISTFEVSVIAQDENGLNSSWSLPLNVTVSQADLGGEPPVADFDVPSNVSVNQTIVFDASGSFDEDGIIVSYYWDFGDGENGSGMIADHVYTNPGQYNVTLVVTDNNDNTYSKSIIVAVASEAEEDEQSIIPFDLGIVIFGCTTAVLVCLVAVFNRSIRLFLSARGVHPVSHVGIFGRSNRIKKIDAKIEKIKKMNNKIT